MVVYNLEPTFNDCHIYKPQIDGLVQERRNSIAYAMELRLYCINPLKYSPRLTAQHHCRNTSQTGSSGQQVTQDHCPAPPNAFPSCEGRGKQCGGYLYRGQQQVVHKDVATEGPRAQA